MNGTKVEEEINKFIPESSQHVFSSVDDHRIVSVYRFFSGHSTNYTIIRGWENLDGSPCVSVDVTGNLDTMIQYLIKKSYRGDSK